MKTNRINMMTTIIFYGALWGLLEATLGHFLHFLPTLISGPIMFPIATIILIRGYKALGKRQYLVYIGFVAAGIKAIDFLLPGLPYAKNLNPMISILFETLVVVVAYPLFAKRHQIKMILGSVITSISWRFLFAMYMFVNYLLTGFLAPYLVSPANAISFVVISGGISSILLYAFLHIDGLFTKSKWAIKPSYGIILLLVALSVQVVI